MEVTHSILDNVGSRQFPNLGGGAMMDGSREDGGGAVMGIIVGGSTVAA